MTPMTLAEEIEDRANGEPIEGIVLSPEAEDPHDDTIRPVSDWDSVRGLLDYEYDHGFGGMECHAIVAWTASRVIFVAEYDGATGVESLPRNPEPTAPRGI